MRVVTIWQQMLSGPVQSAHRPVTEHGVLSPANRWALTAAGDLSGPAHGSLQISGHLVHARHHNDLLRSEAQSATRLPVPSMFTN